MPRRLVSAWTLVSGSVYSGPFAFGEVVAVRSDDADLVAVASVAELSSGEFFYDVDTALLYVHVGADPSTKEVVASYELYFGTFDAHFFRDPLDDATRVVYFEPLIVRSPAMRQDVTEATFGYMPASSTAITLSNVTGFLTEHMYASSFNGAALTLYHYVGPLTVPNTKAVYRGLVSAIDYSDDAVSMRVLDRSNIFDQEYRHVSDRGFFDEATFPLIDPLQKNRPIRKVFGLVEGVIAVNYDFSKVTSDSTNRYWALHSGTSNQGNVDRTVVIDAGTSDTRTYLDSADGINVGDDCRISSPVDIIFDSFVVVTAVNKIGAHYIEHAAIGFGPADDGAIVHRYFVGNVTVVQDGVVTRLPPDCYSATFDAIKGVMVVVMLQTAITTELGRQINSTDLVYCRVYGETGAATLGGDPFGTDSATTGTMASGAVLLWNLMRGPVGLSEAELDTAAFEALEAAADDELGYQLPFKLGDNFPLLRDVVTKIAATMLLKIYLNDDGLWSVAQLGPIGAATKMIADDELLSKRLSYSFDYAEVISDVFVDYAPSEVNGRGQVGSEISYTTVRSTSTLAKRLHRVTKQKTFQSLHFQATQAERLADRLRFYLGDRRGRFVVAAKQRFFDSNITDTIEVSRSRLPGFALDEDVDRTRSFSLVALSKTLTDIELTLDDQKGIEDNAGDW